MFRDFSFDFIPLMSSFSGSTTPCSEDIDIVCSLGTGGWVWSILFCRFY